VICGFEGHTGTLRGHSGTLGGCPNPNPGVLNKITTTMSLTVLYPATTTL